MKMSKKSKIVIYILLGLVAIYFLAPFIYMLFSAFKTEGEAIAYPPKLLPAEWHFENFINAWKSQPIFIVKAKIADSVTFFFWAGRKECKRDLIHCFSKK